MITSKKTVFFRAFSTLALTLIIFVLSIGVVAAELAESEEYTKQQRLEQTVYLVNGDYAAAIDGVLAAIDKDNKSVVPYIKDSVQYFPLRFVCESLGYEVTWDEEMRTVGIKSADGAVSTVEVDKAATEGTVEIVHSRTMVSAEILLATVGCDFYSFGDGSHVIYASGIEWIAERQVEKDALAAMQYVLNPFFRMFI